MFELVAGKNEGRKGREEKRKEDGMVVSVMLGWVAGSGSRRGWLTGA